MLFLLGRKFHPAVSLIFATAILAVGLVLHMEFLTLTGALSMVLSGAKTVRRLHSNS